MKKQVHYIRVSHLDQNTSRQSDVIPGAIVFEEKESGLIQFNLRTKGKVIWEMAKAGEIETIYVHSIDRLGRSTLDILNTIQYFTSHGVNVVSKKEGLQTIIDGKENPLAKLMIGILATLSEFEIQRIKERQAEGIAKAKASGRYKGNGSHERTPIGKEEYLLKHKKVIKHLKAGESLRRTAALCNMSLGTIQKVSKIALELGALK